MSSLCSTLAPLLRITFCSPSHWFPTYVSHLILCTSPSPSASLPSLPCSSRHTLAVHCVFRIQLLHYTVWILVQMHSPLCTVKCRAAFVCSFPSCDLSFPLGVFRCSPYVFAAAISSSAAYAPTSTTSAPALLFTEPLAAKYTNNVVIVTLSGSLPLLRSGHTWYRCPVSLRP